MSLLDRVFGGKKDDHYLKGMDHYSNGEYEEAVAEFEEVISGTSDHRSPYYNLGVFYAARARANIGLVHYRKGKYEDALLEFERALKVNPEYPDLHYYLGMAYENLGRFEEAAGELGEAIKINPEYVEARCHLAICLHELGNQVEAKSQLRKAIDQGLEAGNLPSHPVSGKYHVQALETMLGNLKGMMEERRVSHEHIDRGVEAYNHGDLSAAIAEFEDAREKKPAWADVRVKLAIVYLEDNRVDDAITELVAALELNPRYVDALFYLGMPSYSRVVMSRR
jgi:tetratricopeptide (TPR) repeat protein